MIQRVQTVYLLICIVLLTIITFGSTILSFVLTEVRYDFSSYGIVKRDQVTGGLLEIQAYPFYITTIVLILLAFLTMMSYKNLNRQFRLGRLTFGIYFITLLALFIFAVFGKSMLNLDTAQRELDLGFFLFVAGFPFTFLANIGIKRDKKLLDSLNRLR